MAIVLCQLILDGGDDLNRRPSVEHLLAGQLPGVRRACLSRGDDRIALMCPEGGAGGCEGCLAEVGPGGGLTLPVFGPGGDDWALKLEGDTPLIDDARVAAEEIATLLGYALHLRHKLSRRFGEIAQDFDAMVDATREISRCEDLEDLYAVVAEMGHRLLNLKATHFLCLERYSPFEAELTIVAASGRDARRYHGLKLSTDAQRIARRYYPRYEDGRLARDLTRQEEPPLTGSLVSGSSPYILVQDVKQRDPGQGYYSLLPDTRSEIAVPIVLADGSVWGVLNVESQTPGNFSPAFDLPILRGFARVVSVFVQALEGHVRNRRLDEMVTLTDGLKRVVHISAQSSEPVLITGETGTGKEVVARLLHTSGPRRKGAFVPVNCGALEQGLLMNELFGHAAHSYTGAGARDRGGLFQAAHGGTIFLDEIETMPNAVQEAVLRVVERGEVRRVGDTEISEVDVRILAATNVDLRHLIDEGTFRMDLYYRLKILEITLPPLRERRQSIPLLLEQFIGELRRPMQEITVEPPLMDVLMRYDWPGNVRELKNAVKRMLVFSNNLSVEYLPDDIKRAVGLEADVAQSERVGVVSRSLLPKLGERGEGSEGDVALTVRFDRRSSGLLEEVERKLLVEVLNLCEGDRYAAAHMLGISPPTVYRKIKKLGIQEANRFS